MTDQEFEILLIEDNQPDVFLVRSALEQAGLAFRMEVCSDGAQALDRIVAIKGNESRCPDLLLLDLNLPKQGGYQLLEQLRSAPDGKQVPVIVLSSSDAPKDQAQASRFGVRHFFRKPPDLDAFMKLGGVVRTVLTGAEPPSATE